MDECNDRYHQSIENQFSDEFSARNVNQKHQASPDSISNVTTLNLDLIDRVFSNKTNNKVYQVKNQISQGSFAAVYEVVDITDSNLSQFDNNCDSVTHRNEVFLKNNKIQAMKVVDSISHDHEESNPYHNELSKFKKIQDYVTICRNKKSPLDKHIVNFHDYFDCIIDHQKYHCIVMDQYPKDLSRYITSYERISINTILHLTRNLNVALNVLKSCSIIHLDLKPENILIDHENNPFISDFGHSVTLEEQFGKQQCGSRSYRSPEVMLGLPFDNQTDMFSLGVILLEVMIGFNPLQCDSSAELFQRHDKLFSSTYGHFEVTWIEKSKMFQEIFVYDNGDEDIDGKTQKMNKRNHSEPVKLVYRIDDKKYVKQSSYQIKDADEWEIKMKNQGVRNLQEQLQYIRMRQSDENTINVWIGLEWILKGLLHRDPKKRIRTKDVEFKIVELIKLMTKI